MKQAAKVFLVLGCVSGALLIFPLIIGINAYQKLDSVTKRDDLTGWAIAVLLLVNLIAGICMLCLTDADLADGANQEAAKTASPASPTKDRSDEAYDGLIRLKKLLDDGLISEEEYRQKSAQYLAKL